MDKIWRLLTAIFLLLSLVVLFLLGWIFSGGMFNNTFSVLIAYALMFGGPIGIAKGALAIIDHNREQKEKEQV